MTAMPWGKFFWADWLADPGLRACTAAARGMWMDLLCVAATHEPPGYVAIAGRAMTLDEIARLSGIETAVAEQLVTELKTKNVCSQTDDGTLYSRRIVRDCEKEKDSRKGMCEQCGKPYDPQRSNSRYCSNGCRQQAYRNRNETRNIRNAYRNAYRNASVTLSVTSVTQETATTIGKDKQNSNAVTASRARARPFHCQKVSKKLPSSGQSESDHLDPQESKLNGHHPSASGPATALPEGRAGPPVETSKKPHELTRAEFEQQIAKRKIGGP
jgi:hypothetical protein